jgi:signal transduction histidine kinase/DNA-binding response OmpR family regulator
MIVTISTDNIFHDTVESKLKSMGFRVTHRLDRLDSIFEIIIVIGTDLILIDVKIIVDDAVANQIRKLSEQYPIIVVDLDETDHQTSEAIHSLVVVSASQLPKVAFHVTQQNKIMRDAVLKEFPQTRHISDDGLEGLQPTWDGIQPPQETEAFQSSLEQIEKIISQSTELHDALDELVTITTQALRLSIGACIITSGSEKNRYLLISSNIPGFEPNPIYNITAEQFPMIKWVVQHNKLRIISSIHQSPYCDSPLVSSLKIGAAIGVPLIVHGELFGIMFVFDDRAREFSEEELYFLTSIANRTVLAVTKFQFYQSLRDAKDAAEYAAKSRAEFLARISHELRAPLAAINNLSELLTNTPLTTDQVDYLNAIKDSTTYLLALVKDVLDFSRLEAAKLELKVKEYNLIQVIESSVNLIAIPASQKGLEIAYQIHENVPENIIGDPNRLGQILTNLLTNAVKFTETGYILVEVKRKNNTTSVLSTPGSKIELEFSVRDTGIGISETYLDQLFKPFQQVNIDHPAMEQGAGLGLSICKHLVKLMGGEIFVESSGVPGEGSTFIFSIQATVARMQDSSRLQIKQNLLPHKNLVLFGLEKISLNILGSHLERQGANVIRCKSTQDLVRLSQGSIPVHVFFLDDREINANDEKRILECIKILRASNDFPILVGANPQQGIRKSFQEITTFILHWPLSFTKLYRSLSDALEYSSAITRPQILRQPINILLVDDDPINIAATQLFLNRLGYQADSASNGFEALRKFSEKNYHLAIMDMRMGALDGYETSRAIREKLAPEQQPVIAILTAGVTPRQLNALQNAGIDAYLEKPVTIEKLMNLTEMTQGQLTSGISIETGNKNSGGKNGSLTIHKPTINLETLENLLQMSEGIQEEESVDFLELFFETTPELLNRVLQATKSNELSSLKNSLHALRGSCDIFGAEKLTTLCRDLELNLSNITSSAIHQRVEEIRIEYITVQEALQLYMHDHKPSKSL